jgi:hypothetical protein
MLIDTVTECAFVPDTGLTRLTVQTDSGPQTLELTQSAIAGLLPGLLGEPPVPGKPTAAANAISPIGCTPFESVQGLCGLAFNLGERILHVAVPSNGIASVRQSLDIVELAYRNQKMPRMPG